MTEKDDWLAAIAANPCDCELRAIYGDWLEEHGEKEEADRQRRWREVMEESRRWIGEFSQEIGGREYYDEGQAPPLTAEELIEVATAELEDEYDERMSMGVNEGYKDIPSRRWREFWRHYSIVTGRTVENEDRGYFFSCGC